MTGYLFHTDQDRREMLAAIGASSVQQIIDEQVPKELQLGRTLQIGDATHEMTLEGELRELASRNASAGSHVCFMGAGAYDHFIPAAVDELASRGEFYTSYTPYQAEVSQGNLQAMFEYETLITQLTGLGVSNASLYDGGSAAVEAVLMGLAAGKGRNKVVTTAAVHPHYQATLDTYLQCLNATCEVAEVNHQGTSLGLIDLIDDTTACVLIQHPNFFGCFEDVAAIADAAHAKGALVVQVFDPLSMGLLKRPGEMGVDIAVAEGQVLGNALAFGGPYLGVMACKEELIRRLPGRIAGQTIDRRGKRCWVLTLQTREQHIRRDKATSNICTNPTLLALRATIYLSLLGPQGLRETAEHCVQKAYYARQKLAECGRFEIVHPSPVFKEFVVRDREADVQTLLDDATKQGVLAGVPLGPFYPLMDDCFLVAVTEKRTRHEIDRLAQVLSNCAVAV